MRRRKWHFNDVVVCVLEKKIIMSMSMSMSQSLTNMKTTDLDEMSRGLPLASPLLSFTADNLQNIMIIV